MRKKGSESVGVIWLPGIFIMAILLIFYIAFVYPLVGEKAILGERTQVRINAFKNDFGLTQAFFAFLNSPVQFKGSSVLVKDLVSLDSDDSLKKFKEVSNNFILKNIIKTNTREDKNSGSKDLAWIRIYDKSEEISKYFLNNRYRNYEAFKGNYYAYTNPCSPDDYDSFLIYSIIPQDKIIVMCFKGVK